MRGLNKKQRTGIVLSAFGAAMLIALQPGVQATTLIDEDFQNPIFPVNTLRPAFPGWTFVNSVKSRRTDFTSDLPGTNHPALTNHAIQLEWTSAEGTYDTGYTWDTDSNYTLTVYASPQSWGSPNDRYIEPSIEEVVSGDVLWSASALMPAYNNFGRNPWSNECVFTFYIYATNFTTGTAGSEIRLRIDHDGQRGIYVDNIHLTSAVPPDLTAPTPNPPTWIQEPISLDYRAIQMKSTNVYDPSGWEYEFTNDTRGTGSGWQDSQIWWENDLDPGTTYSYRFRSRDKSTNQNVSSWSSIESATTPTEAANIIMITQFQCPLYESSWVSDPDIGGWVWFNGLKARRADLGNNGEPAEAGETNQVIHLENTNDEMSYDTTHAWSDTDVYKLTIYASPQRWAGANQRYLDPSLRQTDNTILWSTNVALPLNTNSPDIYQDLPWSNNCIFTFEIPAANFSTGTEGSNLRVYIDHSGQRGVFIDNVSLIEQAPIQGTLYLFR